MRAPQNGIMRLIIPTGALVKRGDVLGFVADPYGDHETPVTADRSGIINGRANLPMVKQLCTLPASMMCMPWPARLNHFKPEWNRIERIVKSTPKMPRSSEARTG